MVFWGAQSLCSVHQQTLGDVDGSWLGYQMNQDRLMSIRIKRAAARNGKTLSMVFFPASKRGFCRLYRPFSGKLESKINRGRKGGVDQISMPVLFPAITSL